MPLSLTAVSNLEQKQEVAPTIEPKADEAKAWQDSASGKEAIHTTPTGLRLVESAATLEAIRVTEARADYEIKLIAPGKGSSAFYPAEVLKRDGPNIFKSGTHVYLNHATAAEEAARPEGDVRNLAGVLTTAAEYRETHAKGPGLYARMKVFADHAQLVEDKAPHVGMSIRASGVAEAGRKQDGLPILKELTGAESVDVVTRAGAGGMILTEAARDAAETEHKEASDMDAPELKKLQEALDTQSAINARLLKRALRADAKEAARGTLREVSLPDAAKERVIESVCSGEIPMKDGDLDTVKLAEAVNAAAKTEGAYVASIGGHQRVFGMGAPAPTVDAKESERRAEAAKNQDAQDLRVFESLMPGNKTAAQLALAGRAA